MWYTLIDGIFFLNNYDGVLLQCLEKQDIEKFFTDLHDGPTSEHYSGDPMA
jgi:hypothetical protein